MSLLLEALKKAELAKQNASGQQGEAAAGSAAPGGGLSLEPTPAEAAERALITRDRLPDITQPLEILSEDLPSAGVRREAPAASAPAPTVAPAISGPPTKPAVPTEDAERASARQLFEAKTPDYDPRRPFFIVVGVLGIAILGTLGYFAWEMLAPRPTFYAGVSKAPPAGPSTTSAPTAPTPAPAAITTAPMPSAEPSQPAPTQPVTAQGPASPPSAAVSQPVQPGASAPVRGGSPRVITRTTPAASLATAGAVEAAQPRSAAAPRSSVSITTGAPRVDPTLESAWNALQAGDFAKARDGYQRVLRANPRDRDALLGMATIEVRNQEYGAAEGRYLRVLELDPRDPYAQAGLIGLRGHVDPVQSESALKNLLAQSPDASFLNFYLGNQYAVQARWPDAQGAYFRAFSSDPENADYAYNLAVSLDHLRQEKLALEYYRRALALAGSRAVGFNSAQVEARIRELAR